MISEKFDTPITELIFIGDEKGEDYGNMDSDRSGIYLYFLCN